MQKIKSIYLLLPVVALMLLSFDVPTGWRQAGDQPNKYDMGTANGEGMYGKNAMTIRSTKNHINGFGTLMQTSLPDNYRGKKVRMSGYVRSEGVGEWAGLWLRVDDAAKKVIAFDNMQTRSIKGTTEWRQYEIVLDVPESAASMSYGALLSGTGQLWFQDINFEIVDRSVASTCTWTGMASEPTNLGFED